MLEKLREMLNSKGYILDCGPNYIEISFMKTRALIYVSDISNSYQVIIFDKADGLELYRNSYKRPSYVIKYMIKYAD